MQHASPPTARREGGRRRAEAQVAKRPPRKKTAAQQRSLETQRCSLWFLKQVSFCFFHEKRFRLEEADQQLQLCCSKTLRPRGGWSGSGSEHLYSHVGFCCFQTTELTDRPTCRRMALTFDPSVSPPSVRCVFSCVQGPRLLLFPLML